MVQIFVCFEQVQVCESKNLQKFFPHTHVATCSSTVCNGSVPVFEEACNEGFNLYGSLICTVSPAETEDANTVVKNCADSSGKPRGGYVNFFPATQAIIAKHMSICMPCCAATKSLSDVLQKNWGKRQKNPQSAPGEKSTKLI